MRRSETKRTKGRIKSKNFSYTWAPEEWETGEGRIEMYFRK